MAAVGGGDVAQPGEVAVGEHGALAGLQDPAAAGVEHDQPHAAEVAVVAPAHSLLALLLAVGAGCHLAQHRQRVAVAADLADLAEDGVGGEVVGVEVADVLVDPVRDEPAEEAFAPPGLGGGRGSPAARGVPVVAHVVVVEDHHARQRRQQPADRGVLPGVPVEAGVLLEVRDLADGRSPQVAQLRQFAAHGRRGLVGVDLVAEQHDHVRSLVLRGCGDAGGGGGQRVGTEAVAARGGPVEVAGAEQGGEPVGSGDRADHAGGDLRRGPDQVVVESDLVGRRAGDVGGEQRVVVAADLERVLGGVEHLDGAGPVGLHPDGGPVLVDVAQQGAQHQLGHRSWIHQVAGRGNSAARCPLWSGREQAGPVWRGRARLLVLVVVLT